MDGDDLALWMAAAALAALAVRLVPRARRGARGSGAIAIAAALLAAARAASPRCGTIVAIAILVPLLAGAFLVRAAQAAARGGRLARARRFAAALRWSPLSPHRQAAALLMLAIDAADGRLVDAAAAAERLAAGRGPLAAIGRVTALALAQRWNDIVALPDHATLPRTVRLRALGETGDLAAMLDAYDRDRADARFVDGDDLAGATVVVLALTGHDAPVAELLATLPMYGPAQRAFWLGTARGAAGDRSAADADLAAALAARSQLADAVAWRRAWLDRVPPRAAVAARVDAIAHAARGLARQRAATVARAPVATLAACALYVAMHLVSLAIAHDHRVALWRLGALDSGRFAPRDWWRMLASATLHVGWLHLALNVAGLLVIGPPVEREIGAARMLVLLAIGGAGCSAAVLAGHRSGFLPAQLLVGASGSVMAVVGCLGVLAAARRRDGDRASRRRLPGVGLMIALQIVFDAAHPQVSGAGHLGGLVAGALVGVALAATRASR